MIRASRSDNQNIKFLLGVEDVSCAVADALRQFGSGVTLGMPSIFPHNSRKRACGPAFTVRYAVGSPADHDTTGQTRPAEFDFSALFARAQPGDVAVFDSPLLEAAVLGDTGVTWARHFGVAGCVVNGAIRDVEAVTASGTPVWARHVTPASGRGALVQAEVGGAVSLGGGVVNSGDVVVADGNGVAVIPAGSLDAVTRLVADLLHVDPDSTHSVDAD